MYDKNDIICSVHVMSQAGLEHLPSTKLQHQCPTGNRTGTARLEQWSP